VWLHWPFMGPFAAVFCFLRGFLGEGFMGGNGVSARGG